MVFVLGVLLFVVVVGVIGCGIALAQQPRLESHGDDRWTFWICRLRSNRANGLRRRGGVNVTATVWLDIVFVPLLATKLTKDSLQPRMPRESTED